jgi:glycerol-3-phosphate dehydrogenase
MLAAGVPAAEIERAIGQTAEAVESVPLLAARVRQAGVEAPVLGGLAGMIEGRVEPARWTAALTAPKPRKTAGKVKAA